MTPEQALQLIETAINDALGQGVFKHLQQTNAVTQALVVLNSCVNDKEKKISKEEKTNA